MTTYTIQHTSGAYLRPTMTTATSSDVEDVLNLAMAYATSCATPPILTRDDAGVWYAYEDEEAEERNKPMLVACPVRREWRS